MVATKSQDQMALRLNSLKNTGTTSNVRLWICSKIFFLNKIVNKSLNATYVALIPKKVHCTKVSNYQPISLTTNIYKILAKVLSERIKQVLPFTTTLQQSTFVHGRQILDPIIFASELVDYWRCSKQKGLVIKLDIEKAFDKVNWNFLLSIRDLKAFISIGSIGSVLLYLMLITLFF